jgi:hypothetical protein
MSILSNSGIAVVPFTGGMLGQHPGLRTYKTFQEKALQLSVSEAKYRAASYARSWN